MNWDYLLSSSAQRALRSVPAQDRDRINEALNDMKADPFIGDIARMKGKYQGSFRRRVGSWRIIFEIDSKKRLILIHNILRRTSTTY